MRKKVTIKDVAKEAGVAISTVSNALNGSPLVTEETRQRIKRIADDMGYVPNVNGRLLKSGKSKRICFITNTVRGDYFCKLMDAMNLACVKKGYGLDIVITWDHDEILRHIMEGRSDGYIIFEGKHIQEEDLLKIEKQQIPVIMIDRDICWKYIGSVLFNSQQAAFELGTYLIKLGHRKFCFMENTSDTYDSEQRKKGFFDSLNQAGIPRENIILLNGFFDEQVSYSEVMSLFARYQIIHEDMPTAFMCGNDWSAIGAMEALEKLGYHVPEDISVAGFDDVRLARYLIPSLTTVKNPIENQGEKAVEILIDILEHHGGAQKVILNGQFIERKSTGICKKKETVKLF